MREGSGAPRVLIAVVAIAMASAMGGATLAACSRKAGLPPPEIADSGPALDAASFDAGASDDGMVISVYDATSRADAMCGDDASGGSCSPASMGCGAMERCDNGLDDDCDGHVDEGCGCVPGTVQDCFVGPPGLRHIGACHDGTQRCIGSFEFGEWGDCTGGISPAPETCDELDNDCNGCIDEGGCCEDSEISCPAPGDVRIADGRPFEEYPLRGEEFYAGAATEWRWVVTGGPCDELLPTPTFVVTGGATRDASFRPTLSGDYTVMLRVTTPSGEVLTCTFVVHIAGPGLRVELCWDTSTSVDLDLYLHDPRNTAAWFDGTTSPLDSVNSSSCHWANCEAILRADLPRADWGYAASPLSACELGPHGTDWRFSVGSCSNPRLDIDNNLVKTSGAPENINIDQPRDAESFRVMVENFTGDDARPIINVYCGGHLRATIGAAPDVVPDFSGPDSLTTLGAMWRAADIAVHVDSATGETTGCDVTPLHPPGTTSGHWITIADPSY